MKQSAPRGMWSPQQAATPGSQGGMGVRLCCCRRGGARQPAVSGGPLPHPTPSPRQARRGGAGGAALPCPEPRARAVWRWRDHSRSLEITCPLASCRAAPSPWLRRSGVAVGAHGGRGRRDVNTALARRAAASRGGPACGSPPLLPGPSALRTPRARCPRSRAPESPRPAAHLLGRLVAGAQREGHDRGDDHRDGNGAAGGGVGSGRGGACILPRLWGAGCTEASAWVRCMRRDRVTAMLRCSQPPCRARDSRADEHAGGRLHVARCREERQLVGAQREARHRRARAQRGRRTRWGSCHVCGGRRCTQVCEGSRAHDGPAGCRCSGCVLRAAARSRAAATSPQTQGAVSRTAAGYKPCTSAEAEICRSCVHQPYLQSLGRREMSVALISTRHPRPHCR